MMKSILKIIRGNKYGNKLIRSVLRKVHIVVEQASSQWPLYGVEKMKFNNLWFKSYSELDDYVASSLYYGKLISESRDLHCFLSFAKQSKVILDIGSNVGIYSILSAHTNKDALIYAFEPNEVNAKRLNKNIAVNNLKNVIPISKAVGNTKGTIRFTVPTTDIISDTSSALEDFSKTTYGGVIKWKSVEVMQTTIDDFVKSKNLDQVDLIKIDVEGYEMMVFEGASECIRKFSPIIQCEIFVDENRKEYFDRFLKEHSYTIYMLLNEGLLKLNDGIQQQSGNNFIMMKHVFPDLLTPVEKAIETLFNNHIINKS